MALTCPGCGTELPDGTKFCPECGEKLAPATPSREVRKVVTVLFADVTGSTALGEQLDPEALRSLMNRYFARMRAIIEGHGGTVEKFIGDAVMAVFGIPQVHEDDALRAVRAAWDIRDALGRMNAQLEAEQGFAIRFRTGVTTGEVVAGDPASGTTLVTGDTVNTAARLEQAAPPGEILLGRLTYSLVRDAVDAEPVDPVQAKGKAEPVEAYRLVAVRAGAEGRARHLDAPMVGRDRELASLTDAWRRAVDDRTPHLVTLVAPAGVGKSRLVREFIERVRADGGRALVGRCLSYGEGITYWPVRELVHQAAGITEADDQAEARIRIAAIAPDPDVAGRVASAVGLSSDTASQEELFWAVRRLVEHLATEQPTLVVLEDLHWAEDTLLDLVDYIIDLAAGVPLLLLGTARPELTERRPSFVAPREAVTYLRVEPLGADAAVALLDALPGGAAVPGQLRSRILAAAEGNPLYVEELLGLLRDDGQLQFEDGRWHAAPGIDTVAVPASVQALLAARLEALPDAERSTAQRASVLGRSFEVAALVGVGATGSTGLTRDLLGLVRKELLRPDRPELTSGDAFRFRHVLIRDAAYEALPKAERAALHERFADWLEIAAGDRLTELEEIVGYHLEQAHRYRADLGETGEAVDRLGERAAGHLAAAGLHAQDRGNVVATTALLERALALGAQPPSFADGLRIRLAGALGFVDRLPEAIAMAEAVSDRARTSGDLILEARALVAALDSRAAAGDPGIATPAYRGLIERARPVVERSGDLLAAGQFWRIVSTTAWESAQFPESHDAGLRALDAFRLAGDARELDDVEAMLLVEALSGPTPLPEVLARLNTWLGRPGLGPESRAFGLSRRGIVLVTLGLDGWEQDLAAATDLYRELGMPTMVGEMHWHRSWCDRLNGNYAEEAMLLTEASTQMVPSARMWMAATASLAFAKVGRLDEARAALDEAEGDPWYRTVRARGLGLARVAVTEGRTADALREAEGVEAGVASEAYFLNALADTLVECGVIAALAGDQRTAARRGQRALDTALEKGNVALERKARALLAGDLSAL